MTPDGNKLFPLIFSKVQWHSVEGLVYRHMYASHDLEDVFRDQSNNADENGWERLSRIGKLLLRYNEITFSWPEELSLIYMFVVVNFDALAQASDIWIERRQVVFLCWMQDSNPSGSQTPNRQQN